jgi:hypothetical protein
LRQGLTDPELSYPEKLYLVTVIMLKAEVLDGHRRPGSKAMGPDGKYALHVDYVAWGMGRTEKAVLDARRKLERAGWLSRVYPGTYGRPACYQALLRSRPGETVRGTYDLSLTESVVRTPYGSGNAGVRDTQHVPLTYLGESPDQPEGHPGHAATGPSASETRHRREEPDDPGSVVAACPWHLTAPDELCRNCPTEENAS